VYEVASAGCAERGDRSVCIGGGTVGVDDHFHTGGAYPVKTNGIQKPFVGIPQETVDAVERVEAAVPPLTQRLIGRPVKPGMTANYARLSGPYTAARLLLTGKLDLTDFTEAALADPATLDLGARIAVTVDGNPDPNAFSPVAVAVVLKDGRRLERRVEVVYGSPAKPMSREAHLEKFRRNMAHGRGGLPAENADRLIALVDDLESVADTRALIDLIVPA